MVLISLRRFSKLFMNHLAKEFAKQEEEDLKSLVEDTVRIACPVWHAI